VINLHALFFLLAGIALKFKKLSNSKQKFIVKLRKITTETFNLLREFSWKKGTVTQNPVTK